MSYRAAFRGRKCSGPSMEPTIQNSDIVFAENLSRHFYAIQRGDIIIAKSPSDPKSNICKRVIGLEGDKVFTHSPSDYLKSHSYEFGLLSPELNWGLFKNKLPGMSTLSHVTSCTRGTLQSSARSRYQEVMFGWRGIISRILQIPGTMDLFHTD
ncbi:mitochondrial inner membrane protease subunit 1 isoform X3 [Dromiciops gliroides]|uniref:mitochondrial inner membrane protease subunit 1 isoform X3 n=1 Tax=Dromiciops gliroides TaxID=33562 RepID=UPI001CC3B67B|nr:mitochondrial inner membrane protease subunit 1 isoform X3 [Dromiciops gliroides]XP_043825838.1 mitochondrial inner membrane protease subunit 1 isoform X3 [Dromiciops gliroides]XP_043825839.1 mitochondrial inner membrane protease subunit 1 isoform X3 [Dromiciops gliroides]